jgi:hypothetical protein
MWPLVLRKGRTHPKEDGRSAYSRQFNPSIPNHSVHLCRSIPSASRVNELTYWSAAMSGSCKVPKSRSIAPWPGERGHRWAQSQAPAAPTPPGWDPAGPEAAPLGPPADASDCFPADANPLNGDKLLGEMRVVARGVLGARQGHHLLPERQTTGIGWPSPRIAMDKPPGSIPGNYPPQALGMPIPDLHPVTGLSR